MRSVDEHRAVVARLLSPTPTALVPLADALGAALGEDLLSPLDLPPFDNSAMDGYAVRAADLVTAGPEQPVRLPVTADIPAGRSDIPELEPGTAHRIMTGAPLPPGADSVVPVELTDAGTAEVTFTAPATVAAHIRTRGDDVHQGDRVLRHGDSLSPSRLGLAAAVGQAELRVHRRPRVLILSTGSELREPGAELLPGQIYESNSVMLAAAVREAGCEAEVLRFVPDDVDRLHAALAEHLTDKDLLLTSGGISAGAYEVVKDALTGPDVEFAKVAMQPGMPQGCGHYRGVPVVTLPGNPVSALVSFEVFVRPALRACAGHRTTRRPSLLAALTEPVTSRPGRRQFLRGMYSPGTATVTPVGGHGSHLLGKLAAANCLFTVPEETTALHLGEQVELFLLP
ncbi:molybdopterin molybdenumtransferase MoeA [Pseudonocardiaceae bacterium YIM PH 21723]|nr:molybdopterin molybdenumtransferase MoeA [Pseudonocardiaceae bacterium YIM PH 21723]